MDFRLIVDSCCEAAPELSEGCDFRRIPLAITLGNDTFLDDESFRSAPFLHRLRRFEGRSMSSCPSPQAYADAYARDKANFVVTLSAQLSGSYSAALAGAELAGCGDRVAVIDSRSASAGELLAALRVREIAERAGGLESAKREMEAAVRLLHTFFVLEDLENLVKSGRINRIAARLAAVMQVRPILGADGEGNISLFAKAQGRRNAMQKLVSLVGEHCRDTAGRTLVLTHCANGEQADFLKEKLRQRFARVIAAETGGVSSLYAGEGGVIIAF